ncbi:MAG: hypothetical protein AAFP26_07070, partial [Planctomycetota bacterium]
MSLNKFFATGAALSLAGLAGAATPDLDIDRAYAAELRADAATHTSLLQSGGSGWTPEDGFHLGDASGNNTLRVGSLLQFRYVASFRDDDDLAPGAESFAHGFERPRTQIWLEGNIVNPRLQWRVSFDLGVTNGGRNTASGALRDAYVQYFFEGEGEGFFARWGQFKAPLIGEENIAAEYQLAVERSSVNEFFAPGYSEGILVGYLADSFAIYGTVSDGVRDPGVTGGTGGTPFAGPDADYAFTGRAEVKFAGDWDQFADFTGMRGQDMGFLLGGGFHWQSAGDTGQSASGLPNAANSDYYLWTVDAQLEGDGWSAYAGYLGHTLDIDGGLDVTNQGVVVQGALYVADQVELFARYDGLFLDGDLVAANAEEDYHFLTFGGTYYVTPNSHTAKVTVDVVWALDESLGSNLIGGVDANQADTSLLGGSDDEIALRGQISVLF